MTGASAAGYAYFEEAPEVGVRAWAPTLAGAFAQAAQGVLALGVEPDGVALVEVREVRAQGDTPEALVVNWVNECLYVHEIEGFAAREVEVDHLGASLVHGLLRGEALDPARHRLGTPVKGATLHRVGVIQGEEGVEVRLIVEV
jgi:SHS2 domain-containing protein